MTTVFNWQQPWREIDVDVPISYIDPLSGRRLGIPQSDIESGLSHLRSAVDRLIGKSPVELAAELVAFLQDDSPDGFIPLVPSGKLAGLRIRDRATFMSAVCWSLSADDPEVDSDELRLLALIDEFPQDLQERILELSAGADRLKALSVHPTFQAASRLASTPLAWRERSWEIGACSDFSAADWKAHPLYDTGDLGIVLAQSAAIQQFLLASGRLDIIGGAQIRLKELMDQLRTSLESVVAPECILRCNAGLVLVLAPVTRLARVADLIESTAARLTPSLRLVAAAARFSLIELQYGLSSTGSSSTPRAGSGKGVSAAPASQQFEGSLASFGSCEPLRLLESMWRHRVTGHADADRGRYLHRIPEPSIDAIRCSWCRVEPAAIIRQQSLAGDKKDLLCEFCRLTADAVLPASQDSHLPWLKDIKAYLAGKPEVRRKMENRSGAQLEQWQTAAETSDIAAGSGRYALLLCEARSLQMSAPPIVGAAHLYERIGAAVGRSIAAAAARSVMPVWLDDAAIIPLSVFHLDHFRFALVVPAAACLELAVRVAAFVERSFDGTPERPVNERYKGGLDMHSGIAPQVVLSTGIVTVPAGTPLKTSLAAAGELLGLARRQTLAVGRSCVDFHDVAMNEMVISGIEEYRRARYETISSDSETLSLSGRPYSMGELQGLVRTALRINRSKSLRQRLPGLVKAFAKGRMTATLEYLYWRARDKSDQEVYRSLDEWWHGGPAAPDVWRTTKDAGSVVREATIPDLAEVVAMLSSVSTREVLSHGHR